MKDLSTPDKIAQNNSSHKKSDLVQKPNGASSASKKQDAVEHIKSLSMKLADVQMLAEARLQEIIILSKLVVELREKTQSQTQPSSAKPQKSYKKRFWGIPFYLAGKSPSNVKKDLIKLRSSSLFDPIWYLEKYPDVRESGVDPALHYLKFGAKEGRNPGPKFNTLEYVKRNSALATSGENPLLHYIKTNG
ncbi:hypothetical protein [Bordetella genomosp. 4]|uniref:hypothetical protein n=1 Tax=Bordetella genomosp. 4 TaxID=463044 RepID=UPI000B9EC484|nr:hypothetical protein [Bordetella genomosp. 4]OZI48371.1 hypothetical protein CAL21_10925 [Bordetella genomosp. 4]